MNVEATLLFLDFSLAFASSYRAKREKILQAYGVSTESTTAIMTLYENTKAMVRSCGGNVDFFDIVSEGL